MEAIITVGISGSGKSVYARQTGYTVFERDQIRREILVQKGQIDDMQNLWGVWKFSKENEGAVSRRYDIRLEEAAKDKKDIVCADTNLNVKYRNILIEKLIGLGYAVQIVDFPIDLMDAIKRDERRRDTVGRDIIYKQYQQWLDYSGRKKYVPSENPPCILIDIDGTVAHMNGKRSPFEWDKVYLDDVDETVKDLGNSYNDNTNYRVIYMSGRDGLCESMTRQWLHDNNIKFHALYMRKAGDMRKDTVVKEELFWKHIAEYYNVQFVVDDRPAVCRMWRELGLKVFQVGDPHVEF